MTKTGRYFRIAVWDCLICLAMASSLSITVQAGFNVDEGMALSLATAGLCAAGLIVLFWGMSSRRPIAASALGYLAYAAAVCVAAGLQSTTDTLLVDAPGNLLIPALAALLVTLAVFMLSRKPAGTVVLFVAGFFICCYVQFMYLESHVAADVAFLVSGIVMISYRNFHQSILDANYVGKASFAMAFFSSLAFAGIAAALAAGAFFLVIEPLAPGALELKLFQKDLSLPEVHARNPAPVSDEIDTSLFSSNYDDDIRSTDQQVLDENGTPVSGNEDVQENQDDQNLDGTHADLDTTSARQLFDVLTFGAASGGTWLYFVLAVLGACLLVYAAKKLQRRRRYRAMCKLPARDQAIAFYNFFLGTFRKIGIAKPAFATPDEFAEAHGDVLGRFERDVSPVAFAQLTDAFDRVAYSGGGAAAADVDVFHAYYGKLYKACRRQLGPIRYAAKFFKL